MVAGLERMLGGSAGMNANRMLDALGLPDKLGDLIGAQIDAAGGDWAGFARNMMDFNSGLPTGALDNLFGKGLVGSHFAPKPSQAQLRGKTLWSRSFHTPFGTFETSRENLRSVFGKRTARSIERACMRNPAFKAQMERMLGGRIVLDGRADGKITVQRFTPKFSQIPRTGQIANNPMLSGIYGGLARMENNIKNLMGSMLQGGGASKSGGSGGALKDPQMSEWASQMGMGQPMSFEDILFLLMLKYAKKKEKEILDMAKQLTRQGGKQQFPGNIVGGLASQIQGGGAGGVAGAAAGAVAGQGGQANGAGGAFDASQSDTEKQAMLQKLMNDLQKVYQLLTNTVKSMHDMSMASVRNIR